ncbi:MAG: AAA family ATPase [bacterium]|nr:AAA family ATPase [bacterium]
MSRFCVRVVRVRQQEHCRDNACRKTLHSFSPLSFVEVFHDKRSCRGTRCVPIPSLRNRSVPPFHIGGLGFTQSEVDKLLDEVCRDYEMDMATRSEVETIIKTQYDGYHFISSESEDLYNSTTLMFFLFHFCQHRSIPKALVDYNLRTDLSWVRRITGSIPSQTNAFVEQITLHNHIAYDEDRLTSQFDRSMFFDPEFFPISFYYLGMLTKEDEFYLKLPNVNIQKMFVEYFNQLHHIDVSTKYADMMRGFSQKPDLPSLFAEYWRLYVSQLPEAIFQQVNENFYRTTFMELCSRYLSTWFTWNVERSYPKGRTDLEFVGKYHEKYAGLRIVIEFKYYSNTEFTHFKTPIDEFLLQDEDTGQIAGYVEGLRQEYPEARVSQFVIYCIGNQGFRVFETAAI